MSAKHIYAAGGAIRATRIIQMMALTFLCAGTVAAPASTPSADTPAMVSMPGHVLPALGHASIVSRAADVPLALTLVLSRDDEAGFQQYLQQVYDPASATFRHFLTPTQIAERFGPSQASYDQVVSYLAAQNLMVTAGSSNRMTLSVSGARADVERGFGVHIGDYALSGQSFYANSNEPSLPATIASHVNAVLGLSSLAQATRLGGLSQAQPRQPPGGDPHLALTCKIAAVVSPVDSGVTIGGAVINTGLTGAALSITATALNYQCAADELDLVAAAAAIARPARAASQANRANAISSGSGQTIGIVDFDDYNPNDVLNYLQFIGHADRFAQLSTVTVGGGADLIVANEDEVLLDVNTVMSIAPGASVVVYDGAFHGQGSFQTVFNAMINGGVNIISNSWAYCEDQTTLADVSSIETLLQTAAGSGITVLSGSGDSGSTCLDGNANTVAVPASAPHITSVGGTTSLPGIEGTYGSETWWDGSAHTPPSGQSGFGVSRYFNSPSYQNGLNTNGTRSVPDVTAPADPAQGVLICEADNGGCPNNLLYGGTSIAAPIWAAFVAVLNQRMGEELGYLNASIYPLANTTAFHSAASMGSDFAHVGLGSPSLSELQRRLSGATVGAVNLTNSAMVAYPVEVPADGATQVGVAVVLLDGSFYSVSGQNVTLTASGSAVVTPINRISSVSNGASDFTVTDTATETVTLTAKIGANTLAQTAQVTFLGPPAASGGIIASPTTQAADGVSASTVTVSLEDAMSRPAPGKQVLLAQNGNSLILGDNPGTTGGNGEVQFQVTDQLQETVVYTAVDVSDGNLAVPGTASVTFSGAAANSCGTGATPLAGPGYALTAYASGFPVQNGVNFGGTTVNGCVGVGGIAFDASGNLYASDYVTGDIYEFPVGGGIAGNGNKITNVPLGPTLGALTFSQGNLYAVQLGRSNAAGTGAILKIASGMGTVVAGASGLTCPLNIATDPLLQDLFVTDGCFGTGQDASVLRVAVATGTIPTTTTYATSDGPPNGSVGFSGDGTMYVVYDYNNPNAAGVDKISGTNGPATPTVTATGVASSYSALVLSDPAGAVQSLIVGAANTGGYANSTAAFDMTVTPPVFSGATLVTADVGAVKILGPDNCVYLGGGNVVYKLTNADGSCPLTGLAPSPSMLLTTFDVGPAIGPQGTLQRFTVTFPHSASVPVGTPITYFVSGANSLVGTVYEGFGGALISYLGQDSGNDNIQAVAVIAGATVISNTIPVTWTPGAHSTYLNLNNIYTSATNGGSTAVTATLTDISLNPEVPISAATVQFAIAGQSCTAITNANGTAGCRIGLSVSAAAQCPLSANFAGTSQYLQTSSTQVVAIEDFDLIFTNGFETPGQGGCVAN
jgi:kumamolisin